jgi:hypothetical protein
MFQKPALRHGTSSVVPKRGKKTLGFNPCGITSGGCWTIFETRPSQREESLAVLDMRIGDSSANHRPAAVFDLPASVDYRFSPDHPTIEQWNQLSLRS